MTTFLSGNFLEGRLNKAAGAADATRGGQGSGQGWAGVFCGSQGEIGRAHV